MACVSDVAGASSRCCNGGGGEVAGGVGNGGYESKSEEREQDIAR